jgi:hypothetical protein
MKGSPGILDVVVLTVSVFFFFGICDSMRIRDVALRRIHRTPFPFL